MALIALASKDYVDGPSHVALRAGLNTWTATNTIDVAGAAALVVRGGGGTGTDAIALTVKGGVGGASVLNIADKTLDRTVVSFTNIANAGGYAGSLNLHGSAGNGPVDASGAIQAWQAAAIDQAAPLTATSAPNRDLVIGAKNIRVDLAGIVTTAGSPIINGPAGSFVANDDLVLSIQSTNIPASTGGVRTYIASVQSDTQATLNTGTGVTAGTATATISGTRDIAYYFHGGRQRVQVGFFPRSYVAGVVPTTASFHIGGPYGNTLDPTQLELLTGGPGARQIAPAMNIRQTGDLYPTLSVGMSGGSVSNPLSPYFLMGPGGATAPTLYFGLTSPGPAFTVQRAAAGVQQLLTLQNANGATSDGVRVGFSADTFIFGAVDATNTSHSSGAASLSLKVGSGGGTGTLVERMRMDGNGVAFNASTPFFPNAAAAAASATTAAVAGSAGTPAPVSTASTNTAPYGYVTPQQADAVVANVNALIGDVGALRAVVAQLVTGYNTNRTNLRAYGLLT